MLAGATSIFTLYGCSSPAPLFLSGNTLARMPKMSTAKRFSSYVGWYDGSQSIGRTLSLHSTNRLISLATFS
jgi:hypothetical protein